MKLTRMGEVLVADGGRFNAARTGMWLAKEDKGHILSVTLDGKGELYPAGTWLCPRIMREAGEAAIWWREP